MAFEIFIGNDKKTIEWTKKHRRQQLALKKWLEEATPKQLTNLRIRKIQHDKDFYQYLLEDV